MSPRLTRKFMDDIEKKVDVMAQRRLRECRKPGCYELTRSKEGYCEKHIGEYLAKQNEAKKAWKIKAGYKRPKSNSKTEKFYSGKEWQTLRRAKLAESPLCEECLKHNHIEHATQVHHKTAILKDWNRRYEFKNLESLCYACHKYLRDSLAGKYTWEEIHQDI